MRAESSAIRSPNRSSSTRGPSGCTRRGPRECMRRQSRGAPTGGRIAAAGADENGGVSVLVSTGIPHHNLLGLKGLYASQTGGYVETRQFRPDGRRHAACALGDGQRAIPGGVPELCRTASKKLSSQKRTKNEKHLRSKPKVRDCSGRRKNHSPAESECRRPETFPRERMAGPPADERRSRGNVPAATWSQLDVGGKLPGYTAVCSSGARQWRTPAARRAGSVAAHQPRRRCMNHQWWPSGSRAW